MKKNIIIGAGFSAVMTQIFLNKKAKIIGALNSKIINHNNFLRRKKLETNKLFSKKTFSYGSLNYNIKNTNLHDRLILGGNTAIWGGHISFKNMTKKIKKILEKNKISFRELSFKETGSISNERNIFQLQSKKKRILDVKDIPIRIQNGFINNIQIQKGKLYINIFINKNTTKKIQVNKLFLCIGSTQTIDLLYRSKLLKDNDIIELSEFHHKFKIKKFNSSLDKKSVVIRYHISRALGHLFGIQYYSKILKLFKFIPLFVDQNFYFKKYKFKFRINKNNLYEITNQSNKLNNFGSSIHYCNMKINNISIRKFLKKINPNIQGFGMSFVNQDRPGPISNDIIHDIYKELKKSNSVKN